GHRSPAPLGHESPLAPGEPTDTTFPRAPSLREVRAAPIQAPRSGARGGTVSKHDEVVERLARERGRAIHGDAYPLTWDESPAQVLDQAALVRPFARSRNIDVLWGAEAYVRRTMLILFLGSRRRSTRWGWVKHLVATRDVAGDEVT